MTESAAATDIFGMSRYWDRYAAGVAEELPEDALKNAFGWCQYEGHGPGDELLGDSLSTLELGFGRGNAVAALASKGLDATGVDVSPLQCEQAQSRWGHLPGATFLQGDVCTYLADASQRWDAIYSIWGALWFTDPDLLLPLIHDRWPRAGGWCSPTRHPCPVATAYRGCTAVGSPAAAPGSTDGPTNPKRGPPSCASTASPVLIPGSTPPRRTTCWAPSSSQHTAPDLGKHREEGGPAPDDTSSSGPVNHNGR